MGSRTLASLHAVAAGTISFAVAGCAPASRPIAVPPLPPASAEPEADGQAGERPEEPAPSANPRQEHDDAVLLGTLLVAPHRLGWSIASIGSGVLFGGTSATWVGVSGIYLANGGSFAQAAGPLLFGVGGTALGVYQLASGSDLGALQFEFARAAFRGESPRMLLDTFEPRLRDASGRAKSQRHWFAGASLVLAALSTAAGVFLVASPPEELRSGTYPSVMFGLGAINALAGLAMLTQPTPTETAWDAYVRLTSR